VEDPHEGPIPGSRRSSSSPPGTIQPGIRAGRRRRGLYGWRMLRRRRRHTPHDPSRWRSSNDNGSSPRLFPKVSGVVKSNRALAHRLRFSGHASTRSRAFVQPNPDARVRMNVRRHCREFVLATAAPPYDRRTEAICIGNIDLQEPDVFELPIM